ncbi:unnamed protein product [Tuber melanosporum]|uniref:(Perigord truffle) hypothetical protein n=1 Tax=Tuber melanosporum (strain Mel28) TaxID=656061 RepID=D5GC97_TUBMM|nr:uncharacterized protein GSTUM_00000587001 [Tuber melanosporum]CAZ82140.1 unnamed protein product [Tuber melanosporum]
MDFLHPEYAMSDDGYNDFGIRILKHASLGSKAQQYMSFQEPVPTPVLPRRSARNASDAAAVTNHRTATATKNGTGGEPATHTGAKRPTRKRKPSTEKSEKPKVPKLTMPLSELTTSYDHIPVKDMESWVRRSVETRKQEVEKRGGYVTRPMNSFMLYRSAYADRTKFWCLQNNHQVVSSVSGESWPLEPLAIRDKYNELAKIERINHQAAHPGYKFCPSKTQNGKKKKEVRGPEESEASELEGFPDDDGDYVGSLGGARGAKKTARGNKKSPKGSSQNRGVSINGFIGLCYDHTEGGAQRSSFIHNNPGKTPPMCMANTDMHLSGQYYQTTVRASPATIPSSMHPSVIEDVTIRKTQAPMGTMNTNYCQHALYQADQIDNFLASTLENQDNSKVDPALLATGSTSDLCMNGSQHQNVQPDHAGQFIDGGIFDGQFEIDSLFATANIPHISFADDESQQDPMAQLERGSHTIDLRKMQAYDQSIQGFLDSQESWNRNGDAMMEDRDQLHYDDWLQEAYLPK